MSFPVHTHTMIVQMDTTKLNIHNTDSACTSSLLISVPPSCWGSSEPWEPIFTQRKACGLTPHPAGTGAPWANWLRVRWMAEAENNSLSLSCTAFCCFSCPWDPHGVSLMQVCTEGLPDSSRARQEQLQGWCLLPLHVFLPPYQQQRKRQEWGTHIHQKCKSF